jgi:hypothetical protein
MNHFRHPEVRAVCAFTRVFDTLWQASKGDGTQVGFTRLARIEMPISGKPKIDGRASFEARRRRAPQDDGIASV